MASVSVSPWAAPSSVSPRCSSWTSRCRTSTPSSASRPVRRSRRCSAVSASPRSTSRTTRPRRSPWATASRSSRTASCSRSARRARCTTPRTTCSSPASSARPAMNIGTFNLASDGFASSAARAIAVPRGASQHISNDDQRPGHDRLPARVARRRPGRLDGRHPDHRQPRRGARLGRVRLRPAEQRDGPGRRRHPLGRRRRPGHRARRPAPGPQQGRDDLGPDPSRTRSTCSTPASGERINA